MIVLFPTCEKANTILQPWLNTTEKKVCHIHNYELNLNPLQGKDVKLQSEYIPHFTRIFTGSLERLNEFFQNIGNTPTTVVLLSDWNNEEEHPIIKDRHVWVQMNLCMLRHRIKFLFVPLSEAAIQKSQDLPCVRLLNTSRFSEIMESLNTIDFTKTLDII